ncbi:MAG: hypothetical protein RAO92_09940 [Candidatus Euphemobacter frigidus]|nr:hypothetical protein [Candidatus Euphemobacter frigidus]MDP8276703.1 hypothetical protein [Candidatus Euphemobacter frigidus]
MKLKKQEKRALIMGGFAVLLIVLLWYFYLWENSLWNRWTTFRSEVTTRENVLLKMIGLRGRYCRLQQEIGALTAGMGDRKKGVSVYGFLEKLIKEEAPAVALDKMIESRDKTVQGLYRQTFVTVRLGKVAVPELVNILAGIEASPEGMKVNQLKIKLGRNAEDLLDVDFTVVSTRPLK